MWAENYTLISDTNVEIGYSFTSYFSAFAVRKSTAEIISSSHLPAICSVVLLELLQSRVAGSGIHRDYEC